MSSAGLRRPDVPAASDDQAREVVPSPSVRPLRVSGFVVRKDDLIAALQVYVPELRDVQVTEDGEHFWLLVGDDSQGASPTPPA